MRNNNERKAWARVRRYQGKRLNAIQKKSMRSNTKIYNTKQLLERALSLNYLDAAAQETRPRPFIKIGISWIVLMMRWRGRAHVFTLWQLWLEKEEVSKHITKYQRRAKPFTRAKLIGKRVWIIQCWTATSGSRKTRSAFTIKLLPVLPSFVCVVDVLNSVAHRTEMWTNLGWKNWLKRVLPAGQVH